MNRSAANAIVAHLPYLRRYARALTGSQAAGDAYVRSCLEAMLAGELGALDPSLSRAALFRQFHTMLDRLRFSGEIGEPDVEEETNDPVNRTVGERIRSMAEMDRQVLLLAHTEGFSAGEVAWILDTTQEEVAEHLRRAWAELQHQPPARILIIEDEPIIALNIATIVGEMKHAVIGVASNSARALELAARERPDLVLCDVQLDDGPTGVVTAAKILEAHSVPVVFVTAYPENLLTGERIEPVFLVAKPFEPEVLQVAISQALFCGAAANVVKPAKTA